MAPRTLSNEDQFLNLVRSLMLIVGLIAYVPGSAAREEEYDVEITAKDFAKAADVILKGMEYPEIWFAGCEEFREMYRERDPVPRPRFQIQSSLGEVPQADKTVNLFGAHFPYIGKNLEVSSGDTLESGSIHAKDPATGARAILIYSPSESASESYEESVEISKANEFAESINSPEDFETLIVFEPGTTISDLIMQSISVRSSDLQCTEEAYEQDLRVNRLLMFRMSIDSYEWVDFIEHDGYRGFAVLEEHYGSTPESPIDRIEVWLFNEEHHYSILYVLPAEASVLQEQVVRSVVSLRRVDSDSHPN